MDDFFDPSSVVPIEPGVAVAGGTAGPDMSVVEFVARIWEHV